MGKTYIDTVKYVVKTSLEIDGIVEKPDVVGAIFGQTEGLLGDELDLRELQKSGRIGRIEVNINTRAGKSVGEIILPSSLDRVETVILAAAIETVDRVGPCEAKINVVKIEDTRTLKRDQVVSRAKAMLKGMISEIIPERKEIAELVRDEVKLADVAEYGPEKLAAGPNIDDAEHIIIVEGRADVLTMLKADIRNVIAMQGKVVPKTIQDLSRKKTITAFLDGDRGGDLIIKQLMDCAEIDFVARAPDGKEVEELTKKEIIKCLRNKLPFEQGAAGKTQGSGPEQERGFRRPFENRFSRPEFRPREGPLGPREGPTGPREEPFGPRGGPLESRDGPLHGPREGPLGRPREGPLSKFRDGPFGRARPRPPEEPGMEMEGPAEPAAPAAEERPQDPHLRQLKSLEGSLKGVLLGADNSPISEIDVKDISSALETTEGVETVVFDGIVTQRLVDIANKTGVRKLVAVKSSRIENLGNVAVVTP
ncbi:MAG: DNA primase DnaG [Candidatus Micrarchaeota archaeon]